MEASEQDEAVRQIAREGDPDRYAAALFAPRTARGPLFALCAFNVELARIAEQSSEPQLGEIRLQWWRDALSRASVGETAGHPVADAVASESRRYALSGESLAGLIDARHFDVSVKIESQLAEFVCTLQAADVPPPAQRVLRHMLMAVCGTALAGADEDGIAALRALLRERGGTAQATSFVFGDRLPAAAAARLSRKSTESEVTARPLGSSGLRRAAATTSQPASRNRSIAAIPSRPLAPVTSTLLVTFEPSPWVEATTRRRLCEGWLRSFSADVTQHLSSRE